MKRAGTAILLSILISLTTSTNGFGWGGVGHEAVGLIAEKVLTTATQQKISAVLNGASLADVSTWPDTIKHTSDWMHTSGYHFCDMPDTSSFLPMIQGASAEDLVKGNVVLALMRAEDTLRASPGPSDHERAALAFLVHFMGDIHQPFHAGRPEDLGGNKIAVNWMGRKTNLHAIWDTYLIRSSYNKIETFAHDERAEAQNYVSQIDDVSDSQRKQWLRGYYDSWVNESVVARFQPYSGYNGDQELYRSTYIEVANRRILQAGYRLGALLNSIYDPGAANAAPAIANLAANSSALRASLTAALGAGYLDHIVLTPVSRANPAISSDLQKMNLKLRAVDFDADDDEDGELTR